jgi:hypothetical protein
MTEDRDSIDRDVRATMDQGRAVRDRALQELTELDRLLRQDAAGPPPAERPQERRKEVAWWRRFLFD